MLPFMVTIVPFVSSLAWILTCTSSRSQVARLKFYRAHTCTPCALHLRFCILRQLVCMGAPLEHDIDNYYLHILGQLCKSSTSMWPFISLLQPLILYSWPKGNHNSIVVISNLYMYLVGVSRSGAERFSL